MISINNIYLAISQHPFYYCNYRWLECVAALQPSHVSIDATNNLVGIRRIEAGLDTECDFTLAILAPGNVSIVGFAATGVASVKTNIVGRIGSKNSVIPAEDIAVWQKRDASPPGRRLGGVGTVVDVAKVGAVGVDSQSVSRVVDGIADRLQEVVVGSKVSEVTSRAGIRDNNFIVQHVTSMSREGIKGKIGAVTDQLFLRVIVFVVPPKLPITLDLLGLDFVSSSELGCLWNEINTKKLGET